MTDHRADLDRARAIAEDAGRHLMTFFRKPLEARAKTQTSFVSEADESTERKLRADLAQAFPGEAILGEEYGIDAAATSAWWVLDPLDGTSNFLAGLPLFAVSMARVKKGRIVLAVTHDPTTGETFQAARGEGAWLGDERLTITDRDRGALTIVALRHSFLRRHPEVYAKLGTDKVRCLGSACLELAYVAASRFQGLLARHLFLWDAAAGALLIEEAGGVVQSFDGTPLLPLALPPADYVHHKLPLIAGAPAVARKLTDVAAGL